MTAHTSELKQKEVYQCASDKGNKKISHMSAEETLTHLHLRKISLPLSSREKERLTH